MKVSKDWVSKPMFDDHTYTQDQQTAYFENCGAEGREGHTKVSVLEGVQILHARRRWKLA